MHHRTFKEWKKELKENTYSPEVHWVFDDWEHARKKTLRRLEEMIELKR